MKTPALLEVEEFSCPGCGRRVLMDHKNRRPFMLHGKRYASCSSKLGRVASHV